MRLRNLFRLAACLGVLFAVSIDGAWAQKALPATAPGAPNFASLVVGVVPDYEGSDDYTAGIAPLARVSFGRRDITLVANELNANVLDHPWLRLGPVASLNLGRSNVHDKVVKRLDSIPMSLDLGAFVGVEFANEVDPRIRFHSDLQFTHDVGSVHEGWVASLSGTYWHPLAQFLTGALNVSVDYASSNYMDKFFSIDAKESAKTGLKKFSADGGIRDVRVGSMFMFHFSETWHANAGLWYKRMLSDAADSPVTDDRGSANQFLGGIGVVYTW